MQSDIQELADLLVNDPGLGADLLRWARQAGEVGPNGVFAAYRAAPEPGVNPATALLPRRRVGEAPENRLYHADNAAALRLVADEGLSPRCIYIDPPYGTKQQFLRKVTDHAAYCDAASGAAYMQVFRERLVLLREVLAADGSIFVHLDASMVAEVKLLMDEIFGAANFRGWITRRKCSSKNYTRKTFGDISDYILFYSKTGDFVFNRQFDPRTAEQEAIDFPKIDQATGRRFALVPLHAPGRRNGASGSAWRGMLPPAGKHWQWTPDKLDECDAKGDIYWTRNGTPRRKIWADQSPGSSVANIWHDYRDPFNQNFAITGYPTEKNLDLLKRLVSVASNPGDLVLDCYAGSGTTLAAASALGRRWIGIDHGDLAIALCQRRLIEDYLGQDLLAMRPGFELWSEQPADASELELSEIEFGIIESETPSGVFQVRETVKAASVPQHSVELSETERLVVFDHGGQESVYSEPVATQSSEKRPA